MKALGILGTGSSAGKSWMATAFCAWLHRQGVRVAPFKAQNMSNNAWVTIEGGEMARAQAIQAEACSLRPIVEMNPVLLKPSGKLGSQVILLGQAHGHLQARSFYERSAAFWETITTTLDFWKQRCDVLVMEGAGSPVELNLSDRDLANLRPIHHVDGRWLLVGDIDRGGIYAQLAGTWALLAPSDREVCLGAVVNRFRGDLSLFSSPAQWLAPHAPGLDILGTVPFRCELQPEEEDGLSPENQDRGSGETIAWVRLPHASNLSDCQPWWYDVGVRTHWTADPSAISKASVIVIPGTKNTLADLRWLRATGLDRVIVDASARGTMVIGLCGGYQILGTQLCDRAGLAGDAGDEPGLGLLPVATEFQSSKIIREVTAACGSSRWTAYEIHMGRTVPSAPCPSLHNVTLSDGSVVAEGCRSGNVWGTYLHGWFESPDVRCMVATAANIPGHRAQPIPWMEQRKAVYAQMADHIAAHVNLDPVKRHLGL